MKEYDSLSDNEKRNMLASVANLYYNAEMTQNQIAERFFTSRSKISRMLKEARQLGIVEIKILEPWDRNIELEQEFMKRFSLKDVRVISTKESNDTMVLQKLGEVAAYYLDMMDEELEQVCRESSTYDEAISNAVMTSDGSEKLREAAACHLTIC